jgi:hypothetical protein
MKALLRNQVNFVKEDDQALARKLYQGVLQASQQMRTEPLPETTLFDIKIQDDIEKIIDNLVNIYESKLNDLSILNNNLTEFGKINPAEITLLRNIMSSNTIAVSWNYIVKIFLSNITQANRDKIISTLRNKLLPLVNKVMDEVITAFNILGEYFLEDVDFKNLNELRSLFVLLSISKLIKYAIEVGRMGYASNSNIEAGFNALKSDIFTFDRQITSQLKY